MKEENENNRRSKSLGVLSSLDLAVSIPPNNFMEPFSE